MASYDEVVLYGKSSKMSTRVYMKNRRTGIFNVSILNHRIGLCLRSNVANS